MRYANNATTRVFSIILVVILMLTAMPTSAFASIDDPLNGVTGSGWDDFGGLPGGDSVDSGNSNSDNGGSGNGRFDPDDSDTIDDSHEDSGSGNITVTETREIEEPVVATPGNTPLGTSGIVIDLPADVLADFIAFMENATKAIESPYIGRVNKLNCITPQSPGCSSKSWTSSPTCRSQKPCSAWYGLKAARSAI